MFDVDASVDYIDVDSLSGTLVVKVLREGSKRQLGTMADASEALHKYESSSNRD